MNKVVFDASAILALLNQEEGSEVVSALVPNGVISTVNLSEVVAKLSDATIPEPNIQRILEHLNLEVVPFNYQQAWTAGLLRSSTKLLGLSLGDRVCLAVGMILNLPVITCDRAWASLQLNLEIRVIR